MRSTTTTPRLGKTFRENIDYSTIKTNWQKRGFSCGIWTDSPGQVWADYVHETDELVMLVEGEMTLSFQGKSFRPRRGEEILLPAKAPHTVINTGQTVNRWYYGYRQVRPEVALSE